MQHAEFCSCSWFSSIVQLTLTQGTLDLHSVLHPKSQLLIDCYSLKVLNHQRHTQREL